METRSEIHSNPHDGTYTLHVYEVDEDGKKGNRIEERLLTYEEVLVMLEDDTTVLLVEDV